MIDLIKRNLCYLTGSGVSFFMFIFEHGAKMEGKLEYLLLFLSGLVVGSLSWCYAIAKMFLAVVN